VQPDDDDDVLDLGKVATPVGRSPSLDLPADDIGYRDVADLDFDALPMEHDEPPAPLPPPPAPVAAASMFETGPETPAERLISSITDSTVSSTFNMLSHTVLTQNARTLEDLVKDMLKPMLKEWLDARLPGIVERLVRAEIERVTRGR
jgi:cell pole-organizing protein PopZ